MAMNKYSGIINGDKLSPVLLYHVNSLVDSDNSYSIAPNPIVLGLNTSNTFKIAIKFFNTLSCPVNVDDIQVLMCPVFANKPVKYYDDSKLSTIPASKVVLQVKAYTDVVGVNNINSFELADISNQITLNALSSVNSSNKYVAGDADANGYDTQFGSLGVYFNDSLKRLNPVKISFNDLVVQSYSSCYFIFEVVECTNSSGGFAISASEDTRAFNFNTCKSSGIMKRENSRWQPSTIYKRENNRWVHQVIPRYIRDELSIKYPYDPNSRAEGEPEIVEPSAPTVIYNGSTWSIPVVSNKVEMSWFGLASSSRHDNDINIMENNSQGPKFNVDVSTISKLKVTANISVTASIDGATSTSIALQLGSEIVKENVAVNMMGTMEAGTKSKTVTLEIDTSQLTGTLLASIYLTDHYGDGANLAHYSYNCNGYGTVTKIETE